MFSKAVVPYCSVKLMYLTWPIKCAPNQDYLGITALKIPHNVCFWWSIFILFFSQYYAVFSKAVVPLKHYLIDFVHFLYVKTDSKLTVTIFLSSICCKVTKC